MISHGKWKTIEEIIGSFAEIFKTILAFLGDVVRSNPGNVCDYEVDRESIFKRMLKGFFSKDANFSSV